MQLGATPDRWPKRGPIREWCALLLAEWRMAPSPLHPQRCRVMSLRSAIRGSATTLQLFQQALMGRLVPGASRRWPKGCR